MFLETKTVLGGPAAGACGCLRVWGNAAGNAAGPGAARLSD